MQYYNPHIQCYAHVPCSEELGDDNPWYCSSCQSQQKATRTLSVHHIPPVLIIHLKRLAVAVNTAHH